METKAARAYTPAGLGAASAGIVAWAMGNVVIKATTSSFLVVSLWRHALSLPLLLIAWLLGRDRSLPWRAAGIGGALFAAHQAFHISALRYSTVAVVTIFFSLQPLLIGAAGRRFVGERASVRFFAWSLVAVAGCAIVVVSSSGLKAARPLGTLLAVLDLATWSAYYLATKRARASVGTVNWLLVMTLTSGALIAVACVVAGQGVGSPSPREWALLTTLAISATVGHFLVTWAQPRIHVAASSALILGVPIMSAVGAAIFVNEPFGPAQAIGGLVAICGAGIAMRHLPPPVTQEATARFGEVAT
jgi:drug/metabolite transporter (DMT)-like permease